MKQKIAEKMRFNRPAPNWSPNKHVQWDSCVRGLVQGFLEDDRYFNAKLFVADCGGYFDKTIETDEELNFLDIDPKS